MEVGRIWGRGIEWDAIRTLLASDARTEMGRDRALTASPLTEATEVQSALDLTAEARRAIAHVGAPAIDGIPDVRPALDRAATEGAMLDGAELLRFIPVLEGASRLVAYARAVKPVAAVLAAKAEALPRLSELRDRLRQSLDDDGGLTDRASARLAQLRREIRERRRRLVGDLERLVQSEGERVFADRFVTIRHGRYVVPLRAEARGRMRGIVHDRSQSGQTLFIEPESAVEANNDLVGLLRDEEHETAVILTALTGGVRSHAREIADLVETIGDIDWVFARAHLAERMAATAPVLDRDGRVQLEAARHPLLLAQQWRDPARDVVPVDLMLSPEQPLLLITGPNAGGKTIALKTLALLSLMAQAGCHVPAAEHSRLPIFERLYAVIGDDQSVAENLSTFSAFVKQIRQVLDEADGRSLVLLDELGAGTDPDEGAALARAILEELSDRGALVVATTHLEPLRGFAATYARARNASVEFDSATLAPTFRLVYDRPGQSWALAIAARLGLSPGLIARAETHRSEQARRVSELLAELDTRNRTEAERARELDRRDAETAARLAAARRTEQDAESRARAPPPFSAGTEEPLVAGMAVAAEHLGLKGELVSITGDYATVRAGTVTVRVPVGALRRVESAATAQPNGRPPGAPAPEAASARPIARELLLLGKTTDEARDLVEQYLDDAFMAGLANVRLVHGKGTGALRKAVRGLLSDHPLVESFRDGEPSEGGAGATVAVLKVG